MSPTCRALLALLSLSTWSYGQSGVINTIAGGYPLGDGGTAAKAAMLTTAALGFDRAGNLYVVDSLDARLRKITPQGIISTAAGTGQPAGRMGDGPAASTPITFGDTDAPGVAADADGSVYFTEGANNWVRKLTPDGMLRRFAGSGQAGFGGDGGPALSAQFNNPGGLAFGLDGSLYVADTRNHRIRRIARDGTVSTIAGTGVDGYGGDGEPAARALLSGPGALAVDGEGNLYVADHGNRRVRRIDRGGIIQTVTGGGRSTPASGLQAIQVSFDTLDGGIAVDAGGELYINTPNRIFRVSNEGLLIAVAPSVNPGATRGVAIDAQGNIYRSDERARVLRIDPGGTVQVFAGVGRLHGEGGPAPYALLPHPMTVAADLSGNVYTSVDGLRQIRPDGTIRMYGIREGPCTQPQGSAPIPVSTACISPSDLATDGAGNLYIYHYQNRVYKVTPDGMVTLFPGTDSPDFRLSSHGGAGALAVDGMGNVYVADTGNHRVLKVTASGSVSVAAGNGTPGFSGDGGPAVSAQIHFPHAVAADEAGNLYIADTDNSRVRKVTAGGIISTVAGTGEGRDNVEGIQATRADLGRVISIATDNLGNIYLGLGGCIRKVSPSGIITTVAGTGGWGNSGDGGPAPRALLTMPWGLTVDRNGNIYIADTHNHKIRRVMGSVPFLVEPSGLVFSFPSGAPPARQTLSLASADRELKNFSITTSVGAAWLSVQPATGSVGPAGPTLITVTANPAGLPKGTYSARLTITHPQSGEKLEVPVTMTVSGSVQQLRLSQAGLTFVAAPGAAAPSQFLTVMNAGLGSMEWALGASTLSGGAGWLIAGPSSGRSMAGSPQPQIEVRINTAGLAPGAYYGLVTVTAPGVDNSPQSAVVLLVVTPADQPPGPVVDPAGMIFTAATPQNLRVSNVSARAAQFTATAGYPDGKNWFTLSASSGNLAPGQTLSIEVQPSMQDLASGTYRGTISVRFQPDNVVRTVNLLLVIAPGDGKPAARRADATCTADRLLPVFRSPGQNFSLTAGWPSPVEVEVVDNCGQRMNSGAVTARFSNNDPPLALAALGQGRWSATWASRGSRSGVVEITVRAQVPEARLEGEAKVSGGVKDNPEQPLIAPGGVLNGASFRREAPVAVGSYLSIFGAKLARELTLAEGLPLPLELGNTTVVIGGRRMPLHFTSDGQVNGVLPYAVPDSTPQQMIVRKGTSYSLPETVLVAASEPAVFTADGSGAGQGHVYVATEEGLRLADAGRPGKPGEVIVVYATGLGPVTPAVRDGEPAPADPPARTVTPVTATIQGQPAEVLFAGLAPGLAGLYQVNIVLPEGLIADASAVLVLNIGQQSSSPPVTLAVVRE